MTNTLAQGLATSQNERVEVTLVTQTPGDGMDDTSLPFRVVRQPGAWKLFVMIKASSVAHVANPAFLPMLFAWLLRKPFVVEHDGYQAACPNGLLLCGKDRRVCPGHFMAGQYLQCLRCNSSELGPFGSLRLFALSFPRRWLAQRATRNVAPSRHVGNRVSLPKTQVIYHGVPEVDAALHLSSAVAHSCPVCFAFVGRLVAEKGVSVLLLASRELLRRGHAFRVKIFGDGPERARLEEMARSLGLGCAEFVGAVPMESLPPQLSGVTAIVIPSVWEDVAPLVAAEQLMLGNLVIASDIGGLGEIVDGYGMTFPAGDADALAACMEFAITNPEAVKKLRQRAREHALAVHTEDRMVADHATLYRSVAR